MSDDIVTFVESDEYPIPMYKKGQLIDCPYGESCKIIRVANAEITDFFAKTTRPTKVSYKVEFGELHPGSSLQHSNWVQENDVYGLEKSGKMFVFDII